jgi:hypothetical protein
MTENRGAEQEVTLLQHEQKPQEHTKSVQGEVQLIDTSLLMGDLNLLGRAPAIRSKHWRSSFMPWLRRLQGVMNPLVSVRTLRQNRHHRV